LAVDIIKKVGPRGHFLSQKHTLKHIQEIYLPDVFDRTPLQSWIKAGEKDLRKVTIEKVKKILKEHYPQPLDKDTEHALSELVRKGEMELVAGNRKSG
jgi:trimethylamine--corrinoid protein Co-methyltransferase